MKWPRIASIALTFKALSRFVSLSKRLSSKLLMKVWISDSTPSIVWKAVTSCSCVELVQVEVDLGGAIGHLERVDMVSSLAGLDSLDMIRDPELAVEAVKLDAVGL